LTTAIGVSFDLVDKRTVRELARLQSVAIGNHFPKQLRPQVSRMIKEGVVDKGLNKVNAGKFLQRELTARLGGKAFLQAVPPSYAKRGVSGVASYHKMLATTHTNFARNFGQINAMSQAGVTRYRIDATIDRLTSKICNEMDGRTFELKVAVEHMNQVLDSKDVDEIKGFAPWRKDLSQFNLKAGKKLDNVGAARVLTENGMSMPPYHGNCRTEVNPA